jgi:hypothetical protein
VAAELAGATEDVTSAVAADADKPLPEVAAVTVPEPEAAEAADLEPLVPEPLTAKSLVAVVADAVPEPLVPVATEVAAEVTSAAVEAAAEVIDSAVDVTAGGGEVDGAKVAA